MAIQGNDFHLIVDYYAFVILNFVVSEMKTTIYLCVEMTCLQRKINLKRLITTKDDVLYNLSTLEEWISVSDSHIVKCLISCVKKECSETLKSWP